MSRKKDDDHDLTKIGDLPPLDHPALPQLPIDPPNFDLPHLPQDEFAAVPLLEETSPTDFAAETINLETELAELHFEPTPPQVKQTITEEIFNDVKEELETFVLKHVAFESYPSYSLYITNIVNGQQRNSIKLLLKEYQLLQSETEKQLVNRSLQLKHLLIPRISEYAAIYFSNKLENYQLEIQFSPSEDLTGHHELWDQGPITFESFNHHKEEQNIILPDIFISQAYSIADKRVQLMGEVLQQTFKIAKNEIENIGHYFKDLKELKEKARSMNANAIVGLNFQQLQNQDMDTLLLLVTGEAATIQNE